MTWTKESRRSALEKRREKSKMKKAEGRTNRPKKKARKKKK